MNQPKFNFGDKVVIKKTGKVFEVFAIAKSGNSYSYRDEYYKSMFEHEEDIEKYAAPERTYSQKEAERLVRMAIKRMNGKPYMDSMSRAEAALGVMNDYDDLCEKRLSRTERITSSQS